MRSEPCSTNGWLLAATEVRSDDVRLARFWCAHEPDAETAIERLRRTWVIALRSEIRVVGPVPRNAFDQSGVPRGEMLLITDERPEDWLG